MSPNEETLTQKAVRVYAEKKDVHEPGPIELFFNLALMKLGSLLTLLFGLGLIPFHMMRAGEGHGSPELYLIILSVITILLGSAGINPTATKLAGATAKQLMPGKWSGAPTNG